MSILVQVPRVNPLDILQLQDARHGVNHASNEAL